MGVRFNALEGIGKEAVWFALIAEERAVNKAAKEGSVLMLGSNRWARTKARAIAQAGFENSLETLSQVYEQDSARRASMTNAYLAARERRDELALDTDIAVREYIQSTQQRG